MERKPASVVKIQKPWSDYQAALEADRRARGAEAAKLREGSGFERPSGAERLLAEGAPSLCNTGDPNLLKPMARAGTDTLAVSLELVWPEEFWAEFTAALEVAQAACDGGTAGASSVVFGGRVWQVAPRGKPHGFGYCRYSVESDGVRVDFQADRNPRQGKINAALQVGSVFCMEHGSLHAIWADCLIALESLGCDVRWAGPSRWDRALDLPGEDVSEIVWAFLKSHYVCRADKERFHREHRKWTGCELGVDTHVRIYDKRRELADKAGPIADRKRQLIMSQCAWNGEESLMRVEYQLRRDSLRDEYGVDTMGDLLLKERSICERLTQKFLRVCSKSPGTKHQERAPLHRIWERVQNWFGVNAEVTGWESKRRERAEVVNPGRLFDQIRGCITSALAALGWRPVDEADCLRALAYVMENVFVEGFEQSIAEKYARYAASVGRPREEWLKFVEPALGRARVLFPHHFPPLVGEGS